MLEGVYPSYSQVESALRGNEIRIGAFDRNFAASFDELHEDIIIEYKGVIVGHSVGKKEFRLKPIHEHLQESLMEAVG